MPEVAREIIKERLSKGLSPRPAPAQFAQEIFAKEIEQYDQSTSESLPVFFDRGIGDALCMLAQCGAMGDAEIADHLDRRPYNRTVFLFPPWREIYTTDAERDQSYEEAIEVYNVVCRWYGRLGFTLTQVPTGCPEQRAEFILNAVIDTPDRSCGGA
jgi:predicted ATPase